MEAGNGFNKNEIMDRVLEVRYSDLDEERRLCLELETWAKANNDSYALAFAYTYLGDYYIAQNDSDMAGDKLFEAKNMLNSGIEAPELNLRMLSLLAIYYDMKADEQSSIQYYMDALSLAKVLGDVVSECLILNNLAFAFSRHKNYTVSFNYLKQSYDLLGSNNNDLRRVLLSNLGCVSVYMGEFDEAKSYFEKCDQSFLDNNLTLNNERTIKNWCMYYSWIGDKENALLWSDRVFEYFDIFCANRLSAFENYSELFSDMLKLEHKKYAYKFFRLLEEAGKGGGLDQQRSVEESRVKLVLAFEPEENHDKAYRTFYIETRELKKRSNLAIAKAMKAKIKLYDALNQNEELQCEQKVLEREANVDELTQIYNRRYLDRLIREHIDGESKYPLGIIMLDVDYFKEYNDFYGHLMGDDVLISVAKILNDSRAKGIVPCRYGGDEFCCVCIGVDDKTIEEYINRVRDNLYKKFICHGYSNCSDRVTMSIGYAYDDGCNNSDLYILSQLADQALYSAKLSGRNTYTRKFTGEA